MGSVVGAAVGGLAKGFAGGGDSSSSNEQSTTHQESWQKPSVYAPSGESYTQSIPIYQQGGTDALSYIKEFNQATKNSTDPYVMSSYGAMDSLLDSMGIARPKMGTFQAQEAQRKYQEDLKNAPTGGGFASPSAEQMSKYNADLAAYNQAKPQNDAITAGKELYSHINPVGAFRLNIDEFGKALSKNPDRPLNVDLDPRAPDFYGNKGLSNIMAAQGTAAFAVGQQVYGGYSPDDFAKMVLYASQKDKAPTPLTAPTMPTGAALPAANPIAAPDIQMTDPNEQYAMTQKLLESDPNYRFQMDQGTKAIQRMNAAKGIVGTPRVANELIDYAQGQAAAAMNTYRSMLSQIVGTGLQGTNIQAGANQTSQGLTGQVPLTISQLVAGATQNATNDWRVGPITQYGSTDTQMTGSKSSGPGLMTTLGNGAKAVGTFGSILGF